MDRTVEVSALMLVDVIGNSFLVFPSLGFHLSSHTQIIARQQGILGRWNSMIPLGGSEGGV